MIGNLPVEYDEDLIASLFTKVRGTIVSIDVPKNGRTGSNRGYATVELQSRSEALAAVESLVGLPEISGRSISISIVEATVTEKRKWFHFGSK